MQGLLATIIKYSLHISAPIRALVRGVYIHSTITVILHNPKFSIYTYLTPHRLGPIFTKWIPGLTHTQRSLSYRVGISWCPSISTCLWVLDHQEAMGGMQVCVNQEFLPLPNTGANPSGNSIKRPVSVLVPTFKSKLCMHICTYIHT